MLSVWLHSLLSFRSYHRLRLAGPWRTGFFALYLAAVGFLICNCFFAWQIHRKLPLFIQHFPTLTFEQGKLVAPQEPVSVSIADTGYSIRLQAQGQPPTQQQFIDQHLLAFVSQNQVYIPSVNGVSVQELPVQLNGEISSQWLEQQAPALRTLLQSMALFFSAFLIVIFVLFSFALAFLVLLIWRALTRQPVPLSTLWRWAVFLQGPAFVLLLLHLFVQVPLFFFALFILFNIYVQQIFNTLPDERGTHYAA